MEAEELIASVQEYIDSPRFLSLTRRQKKSFVEFGIPMLLGLLVGIKLLEFITTDLELNHMTKQLEISKLDLLWNTRNQNGKH